MNQLTNPELLNVSFHAWNCITLQVKNKGDVYLIIKNEDVLSQFIKFLIYSLETMDGIRGTARSFIKKKIRDMMSKDGCEDPKLEKDYEKLVRH